MTRKEANERYEKLSYELAKEVGKLAEIKSEMESINDTMGYDGMFICDFQHAMELLGQVEAASVVYAFEDKYRASEIKDYEQTLKFFKEEPK